MMKHVVCSSGGQYQGVRIVTYQRNETPEPLASGVESAIDEAGYTLLADLAGIDCYDTNLRDQPEAYAALDRYREACAKAATPAPGAPGQEALADILKDLDHICAHGDAGSQETAHDARDKLRQFVTNSTHD